VHGLTVNAHLLIEHPVAYLVVPEQRWFTVQSWRRGQASGYPPHRVPSTYWPPL